MKAFLFFYPHSDVYPVSLSFWFFFLLVVALGFSAYAAESVNLSDAIFWQPLLDIDCVKTMPDSHVGDLTVVASSLGEYLQAGDKLLDRFAYCFTLPRADQLVRVTIVYPDDKIRAAGVAVWGPPQEALGSGYMTGDEIPISDAMLTRQFIFFCQNQNSAVVIGTEVAGRPAALAHLKIEYAASQLPAPAVPPAIMPQNPRRIGLYWEDPVLARCFGCPDSVNPDEFEHVLRRCLDYCQWIGLNTISYPAYWCNTPIYESTLNTGYPYQNRLHPQDFLQRLASRCAERGISYTPSFNIWQLSSLRPFMRTKEEIIQGQPGANCVDHTGKILTAADMNNYWTVGPILNVLFPEVQKALTDLTLEVARHCAPYDSFRGVDFFLWPASPMKTGGANDDELFSSYDDYSVNAFAQSIQQTPPGQADQSGRFTQRYHWIVDDPVRKKDWIDWRCARVTAFYADVADKLDALKPGLKLGIGIYAPSARPQHQNRDINEYFRVQSLDIPALSQNEKIIIKRFKHPMAQLWRARWNYPRPENLNLDNDPAYQAPLAACPRIAAILHQQYFESNIKPGPFLTLPDTLPAEVPAMAKNVGLRVTEPLSAGRDYLRYFAFALANLDVQEITVGGYILGTQGVETELAEFAHAFQALPAVKFHTLYEKDNLFIRTVKTEQGAWFYLLNCTSQPRTLTLRVENGVLSSTADGKPLSLQENRVAMTLQPYQLISLYGDPAVTLSCLKK